MKITIFAALLMLAPAAGFAQKWDFGFDGGYSFLNNVNVTGGPSSATAGFAPGFAAGAFIGENLYRHFSGEIRYEYMQSDLQLKSGGQDARFTGAAHAIHYDLVFHSNRGESPVQFFASVGGGVKAFVGTGTEAAYQPLSQYGFFTKTQTAKPMLSAGAGVTFKVSEKVGIRFEVRDFTSAFPTAVLTPPQGIKYGTLLNQVVPMVSFVYTK
jgi:hypothetical protein